MRAAIVDDEPLVRERIRALLEADGEVTVAGEAGNGLDAIQLVKREKPDLLFLDVQMPELDGFGVLERLADQMPVVVFITAYDEYALRAFEVHAQDYLLKPFDRERFEKALAYAKRQAAPRIGRARYPDRLMVKESNSIRLVRTAEVEYIEAAGNYVCLRVGNQSYVLREALADLEARLDPSQFVRIHRSYVVNREFVAELRPWFQGDYRVVLTGGAELPLSRGFRESAWSRLCQRP